MPFLYDIGLGLYHAAIRIAAPFVPKAKAWVDGRTGTWQRLEAKREALHGCLWIHCASVGEFEQGRPVIEAIRKQRPSLPILITFYSPSGYEACKNFPLATHVEYLPADSTANARRLLNIVRPKVVLWVKYEFWHHWLHAIDQQRIPLFLVSAIFRKDQPFFRWYGSTHRSMLKCFTQLFVQDSTSFELLASIGVHNVTMSGDTRFDRVAAIVAENTAFPLAAGFKSDKPLLIAGSTWPADEALLLRAFSERAIRSVIVPHEVTTEHLANIEAEFPKPLARWSELEGATEANIAGTIGQQPSATLLVDRMGLLARLYKYATITYVGGGFGDGIHSLLEAAAWGSPVIFGPRHHKFAEAKGLIDAGGGFEVDNSEALRALLDRLLDDPQALEKASHAARTYVMERLGAGQCVTQAIDQYL